MLVGEGGRKEEDGRGTKGERMGKRKEGGEMRGEREGECEPALSGAGTICAQSALISAASWANEMGAAADSRASTWASMQRGAHGVARVLAVMMRSELVAARAKWAWHGDTAPG